MDLISLWAKESDSIQDDGKEAKVCIQKALRTGIISKLKEWPG